MTHTQTQGADGAGTLTAGQISWKKGQSGYAREALVLDAEDQALEVALTTGGRIDLILHNKAGDGFDDLTSRMSREDAARVVAALIEAGAPAPAATPGVPDSLRALLERAREMLLLYAQGHSQTAEAIDDFIAAQPAGQAGDAGVVSAPQRVERPFAYCCNMDPATCDCANPNHGTALFEVKQSAPNSPRTGAAETGNDWLRKAADEIDKIADLWSADGRTYAKTIAAMFRVEADRQGLAARPEAPSDAGWLETQVEDLLDLLRIEREAKATTEARAAQLQAEVEAKDRALREVTEQMAQPDADDFTYAVCQALIRAKTIARTALAARAATAREGA